MIACVFAYHLYNNAVLLQIIKINLAQVNSSEYFLPSVLTCERKRRHAMLDASHQVHYQDNASEEGISNEVK